MNGYTILYRLPHPWLWVLLAISGFMLLFSCRNPEAQENRVTVSRVPVVLGIAYDISASVQEWPELDSLTLRELAFYVGRRGGLIAVGHIREDSYLPLQRYPLKLDAVEVKGKLSERAHQHQYNLKRKAEFSAAVAHFVNEVREKIVVVRNKKRTDINGALKRYRLFFAEPQFADWDKILILISDGRQTTGGPVQPFSGAQLITVGWPCQDAAAALGQNVICFESLQGMTAYLHSIDGDVPTVQK